MIDDDTNGLQQPVKTKYKPSKVGKIALVIAISGLSIGWITLILNFLSIINSYMMLIVIILSHVVSIIAFIFLLVDVIKFNRINHVNENSDSKLVLVVIIGIIIGFIWGKIL